MATLFQTAPFTRSMQYALSAPASSQEAAHVTIYGAVLWEWVTNSLSDVGSFTTSQCAICPALAHLTSAIYKRHIIRTVLSNVIAQNAEEPELAPIKRVGDSPRGAKWAWADMPR